VVWSFRRRTDAILRDVGVDGDPDRWCRVAVLALVVAAAVGALRGGTGGGVAAVSAVLVVAGVARVSLRGRGDRRADAELPELLDHVGRALRSGLDLVGALRVASGRVTGRHADELAGVTRRIDNGASVVAALEPWGRGHPRSAVRLAVAAIEVAVDSGATPARALEGVAATLRDRNTVAGEARTLASQAQASALVLVALPLVFAVVAAGLDTRLERVLVGTFAGRAMVLAAVGLDVAGALWMRRILGD